MSLRTITAALAAGVLIVAALEAGVATADPAPINPNVTACPAAYELLSVTSLEATGPYVLPRRVDSAGNNDGLVCGLPMPTSTLEADCKNGGTVACLLAQLGLPLYRFKDNHVTQGP
jgi:hypothetical protein